MSGGNEFNKLRNNLAHVANQGLDSRQRNLTPHPNSALSQLPLNSSHAGASNTL